MMRRLLPLFLISLAAVGYEIALTRFFAITVWSEYGYWVISIVMVGFALSGVVLALWRDVFVRHGALLQAMLPAALVLTAALGFHFAIVNPFNPLQLQNQATWLPQFGNIALYYVALLPFFFLAGLYVSLSFVLNAGRTSLVYGYDLTGAGLGAALVLALMFVLHAFLLVPALLVPLAVAGFFPVERWRLAAPLAAVVALLAGEALLLFGPQADFNDFKAIYAPLHTPDARIVAQIQSPRGDYLLLDDFTERVDTDISNDAGMLGLSGPPRALGLYRDGNRIAALPRPGKLDVGYADSALDALPYQLIPHARVLLAGASGGFRIAEVLALGAAQVEALEPEPVLHDALRNGLGPSPAWSPDPRVTLSGTGPVAATRNAGHYDVIDLSADFLDAAEANVSAFSQQAITAALRRLTPGGIVSIPVSIRDFPVYALRMLATVRAALLADGVTDPGQHVVVYRSAWSVRILVSVEPWDPARIAAMRKFCDDRSFDVSWYPGIDVSALRSRIYNDLPAVSFTEGEVESGSPDDAIADEAGAVLAGAATPSDQAFNLTPITFDRPAFYAVLRLNQLGTILSRLEILPQQEIGALVNLAVLAQASVIALLVVLVPFAAPRRLRIARHGWLRAMLYFPALALGFLFIEIFMIEQASFWLNDRTGGFALVLTGMLIFSGVGSLLADRFAGAPQRTVALAGLVVVAWSAALLFGLRPAMLATLGLPWLGRGALILAVTAPVSLALGLPFPLGLQQTGSGGMLPWAWGLNGAFSVVATPLANLIAREAGFDRVLLCAAIMYVVALVSFPSAQKSSTWRNLSVQSRVGE
jgi:hypothetical protein